MTELVNIIVRYRFEIAGTLIMAFIAAYLAGLNSRLNRLAAASEKFRNVFMNELKGLYPIPSDWPKDSLAIDYILRKAFPNLQSAVTEFRRFIPWYRRKCFDSDWFRYRCSTGRKIDAQCYHHYMPFSGSSIENGKEIKYDNTKTYKETFKNNVDNLLKYAKKT